MILFWQLFSSKSSVWQPLAHLGANFPQFLCVVRISLICRWLWLCSWLRDAESGRKVAVFWFEIDYFGVLSWLFHALTLTISCPQLWLFCITKHCFLDAEVPKIVPKKRFPGIIDMISWHFKMCKKVSSASRDATFIACHQTVGEEETEQLRDNRTTHAVGYSELSCTMHWIEVGIYRTHLENISIFFWKNLDN